jgi:hypothetical protein
MFCLPYAAPGQTPPAFTLQPTNQAVNMGDAVSFVAKTGGSPPINVQWRFNGVDIAGATNRSLITTVLTLTNVQPSQAGIYTVLATNLYGSILSSNAVLTVGPPAIITQPANQTVVTGNTAAFTVEASGAVPLLYQWKFNGTNLADATNALLTLTNVQFSQAGNYAVLVTNVYGSLLGSNAVLTVINPGPVSVCDEANLQAAVAAGGTITFGCDGVITLTQTLNITKPTTLDGTGHTVTISGGNAVGLFSVNPGVTASFMNLTLANGCAAGSNGVAGPPVTDGQPGLGGAILNNGGTVALTGCTVVSNLAIGGTGYTNCPFPSNSVGGVALGGAIYNLAGNLSVTNCSFIANSSIGSAGGHNMGEGGIGGDACGGAIYSQGGSVTVWGSTFVSQAARGGVPGQGPAVVSHQAGSGLGGAIWASNATVNCYNTTFSRNLAVGADLPFLATDRAGSGKGGAIFAINGTASCVGCAFLTNSVAAGYKVKNGSVGFAQGGAIWSLATLSVSESRFLGNQAAGQGTGNVGTGDDRAGEGSGGAIFSGNTLSLSGSTFANNTAKGGNGGLRQMSSCPGGNGQGGAVCNLGTLTATNCTLVANSALGGIAGPWAGGGASGGNGTGGGVFNNNGTATLVNLTFASNNAAGGAGDPYGSAGLSSGGAICNSNGTVNLYNTIVASSTSGSNCWGTMSDLGYNLGSDHSAGFYAAGSLNNTDPILGPLDDYGGPTPTMALLTGSPAIDGGSTATAPTADQRGRSRPYGAAADIGAFESSPPYFIGGQIAGLMGAQATVSIGSSNHTTTGSGSYGTEGFAAGAYTVTPAHASFLFSPTNALVTVGPDQATVNFEAYLPAGNPPTFTTQPASRTNVAGTVAIFAVSADGTAPLKYQWRFNGTPIFGATGATLMLTSVEVTQAGNYDVYVTNYYGSVLSSNAVLTILTEPPGITAQPTSQIVLVGGTAGFSVSATGTAPLRYQWTCNGTNIAAATNATLTLTNVQLSQAGNYSVSVTNLYSSVLSSNAVLTVGYAPSVVTQPTNQTVLVGGAASFSVAATGTAPLSYQWFSNIWDVIGAVRIPGATNDSLTLPNVPFSYNGKQVWVQITNIFGSTVSSRALLTVLAPPTITQQPADQLAAVGSTVSLVVAVSGTTNFSFQWSWNGTNIVGGTNATLTITNVQFSNAGYYAVLVTNLVGSVMSSNALLTVSTPPVITGQPASCTNVAGTTAAFTVVASGFSPLSYQWRFNGTNLANATNATLTLNNVQPRQAGSYAVLITNLLGSTLSYNAVLTVDSPPYLNAQPQSQTMAVGGTVSFSVVAGGQAPLHYEWTCNGTNLPNANNATLTLTNVQFSQAGNYAVLVTNTLGSILSSNAWLTVIAAGTVPVCDEADLRAAVAVGGTITFDCDGVITLTQTLNITEPTTLDGTGHIVTISGGGAVRLVSVNSGVSASFINLTLANGRAAGSNGVAGPPVTDGQPGLGGAILNNGGIVALTGCIVASNLAAGGAGYTNCIYPANSIGGHALGGAIYNLAGSLAVTNCSFLANATIGGAGGRNLGEGGLGGDACGGAISSLGGSITVQNSTFVSHAARGGAPGQGPAAISGQAGSGLGGAIWTSNATANFYNSTFAGNLTVGADLPFLASANAGSGEGGAIFATSGTLTCFGCTFTTNSATAGFKVKNGSVGFARGGAIWSQAALSVSQSSFIGNQAAGQGTGNVGTGNDRAGEGSGGAIFSGSTFALATSTFANNSARGGNGGLRQGSDCPGGTGRGGAICNLGALTATNCTLVANSALGGIAGPWAGGGASGGDGTGGGLFNTNGTVTLVNLTFASNNAAGGAGDPYGVAGLSAGGAIGNTNGTVNLYNTLVASSTSGSNCWGTVLDYGHNLSSDNSAGFYMTGSLNNADPILGPLDDYGGPTLTMVLLTGSPAIDSGSTATAPATDQRGRTRPYGAAADIGAFESSAPFIVKGNISGSTEVVIINAGSTNVAVTNSGTYWFRTLAAGSYVILPTNANYVFAPNSRSYTLGPDQLNADFKAYRWNTINVDSTTGGIVHLVYAGTNGQTYRVLTATSPAGQWLPVATNFLSASNYFDVSLPMAGPDRFYRTVSP